MLAQDYAARQRRYAYYCFFFFFAVLLYAACVRLMRRAPVARCRHDARSRYACMPLIAALITAAAAAAAFTVSPPLFCRIIDITHVSRYAIRLCDDLPLRRDTRD